MDPLIHYVERGAVEGTSGLGRLPIGICAVSAIGCVAAVLWACSIDRRMARHNLRRLTGCCLQCEAARDRAAGSCRACGSDYRIQDMRVEHL